MRELGFDLRRFVAIGKNPDVVDKLKLRAKRMVTDVPTKTLQWASGFSVFGHDGTFGKTSIEALQRNFSSLCDMKDF